MARRATSSTKERNATRDAAPAEVVEQAPAKATRRGGKPRQPSSAKPTAAEQLAEITAQPMAADTKADDQPVSAKPSPDPVATADAKAVSPAVRWDAQSGAASFDWPVIEAVAATSGPNQAMAKLLLAARAEGASSRWPF